MPKLRIPERYRPGASALARLPAHALEELQAVLLHEPPLIRPIALFSSVATKVKSIPEDETRRILDALFALDSARDFVELSVEQFAEDMSRTDDLTLSEEDRTQFRLRLQSLLSCDAVSLTAKAATLLNEAERRFHDARIVTDVRPIYRDSIEGAPAAAMILHTLRIRYHRDFDGKLEDVYLSLDTGDIQELRAVIDRADAKAMNLQATLVQASVPYLTLEGE